MWLNLCYLQPTISIRTNLQRVYGQWAAFHFDDGLAGRLCNPAFLACQVAADPRGVLEALFVFALVGVLAAAGFLLPLVSVELVITLGFGCIAAGLLLGVPTGLWYHVKLRAALLRCDALPARWWLRPVALHGNMAPQDRAGVLPWFYAGGLGFVGTVLGCVIVFMGVLLEAHRAGLL